MKFPDMVRETGDGDACSRNALCDLLLEMGLPALAEHYMWCKNKNCWVNRAIMGHHEAAFGDLLDAQGASYAAELARYFNS